MDIVEKNVEDAICEYISKTNNRNICEWYVSKEDLAKPRFKGIKTCVSVCKDYLGISNPFILTSLQLFKYLRQHHAINKQKGIVI